MLDIIDPSAKYSMIDFRKDAYLTTALSSRRESVYTSSSLKEMGSGGEVIPIICGGTGLYIDAVLYDMDAPENPPDWEYRKELEIIRQNEGNEKLWQMLYAVDPEYANELDVGNYRYIMRGLEVMRDTGKSKRESHGTKRLRFSPLFLTPYTDSPENRKALYGKIDTRVADMFEH